MSYYLQIKQVQPMSGLDYKEINMLLFIRHCFTECVGSTAATDSLVILGTQSLLSRENVPVILRKQRAILRERHKCDLENK